MKVEQSIPNLDQVSESITDLTPEQQALLLRWLQSKRAKSGEPEKAYSSIPRAPRDRDIPASFAQQRLWFLDQLAAGSAAYNIPQAARISGALDISSLHRAFNEVVRRHESLRTTFAVNNGLPLQLIAAEVNLDLPVIDLEGLSESEGRKEIERRYMAEASQAFDLASGPLLRVKLLRLSANNHVLLLVMHHIISDGWSMGILVGEIAELYEAYSTGRAPALPPMPIQYADYAFWQREWLSGEVIEEQLSYWRAQLSDAPPILELHTDFPRGAAQGYHSARETCVLDRELSEGLQRLSRSEGVTLFMTLLSVFATLLSRHSGQKDVVIGTPIAGRTRAETEGLIGVFINALALRVNLHGDPSFQELLQRVRNVTLGAYEHQVLPFEKLVEELRPERDARYTPLFQVALVLQNTPSMEARLSSDLQLSTIEFDNRVAKYELTITAEETGPQLLVTFEYARDLFAPETIVRLLGQWRELLRAVVAAPATRLSELPLMSAAEERELAAWNATAGEYELSSCLHELVEQQAARTPERIAVGFEDETVSYEELNRRANQLARYLVGLGVGPETKVGVLLERSVELVVGLLAILKAGGCYVPLDPQYPEERLRFMLADSGATVLLTQGRLREAAPTTTARVVYVDSAWEEIARESGAKLTGLTGLTGLAGLPGRAGVENLAYVIYTSGSTGQPKGVCISHRAICNRLQWMQTELPLEAGDCVLQKTSISFDASVWELFVPLLAGARVQLAAVGGEKDSSYLVEAVQRYEVTVLQLVPSMLRVWLEEDGVGEGMCLRRLYCGGEALSAELAARFYERLPEARLHNLYGPTETAIDATHGECEPEETNKAGLMPIGRPLTNLQVYVLDEQQRQVPAGVSGELYVGGAGVARGYLGRAELTAERFVPDAFGDSGCGRLYRTGDIGRRLWDGRLEYVGRGDEQVKVRGYRIELGEIEAALSGHEGVAECVVVAREEADGHKRLFAYVVPEAAHLADELQQKIEAEPAPAANGKSVTPEALRLFLESKVPAYMVPSAFTLLEQLPRAPNGKIDRRALPVPEVAQTTIAQTFQAPTSPMETQLAEIWADVLGVERVGIDDNFFALGGDSIRSIQMRALAKNKGLGFSLAQIFTHQTVRELASVAVFSVTEPAARKPIQPFELVAEIDRAKLPADVEDAYPLSALQMGMIYHSEFTSSAIYQNTRSYKLAAVFDRSALETALSQIIARHMALRTSFDLSTYSEPLQLVHARVETPLTVYDLRQLPSSEQNAAMAGLIEIEQSRRLDRSRAPMVRFSVHLLDDNVFQFTMTEHHAVLDGWSVAVFLAELFQRYLSLVRGDAAVDPPALSPPAFRDYVILEHETLQSEQSRRYWDTHFDAEIATTLPRWSSLESSSSLPVTLNVQMPLEVTVKLAELAQSLSVPVKTLLLAAHLKVMSFVSGQQAVVTGLIQNGRLEEAGGDTALGLFLNTLPFQMDLPESSWADLVRETFAAETAMIPHRRYPLSELQKRRPGQPLFETAFNYTHFHVLKSLEAFEEIKVMDMSGFGETNFTLLAGFNVDLASAEVHLLLGYNQGEIPEDQIRAIGEYYKRALTFMTRDPQASHLAATLLSEKEEKQQLVEWNETTAEYPLELCIHELFEAQVERTPEAVALVCGAERLSYATLNARANRLAHLLQASGVGPEVAVGVLLERSVEMVVGLLAILKAGGAYVPLDPSYPSERLAFMLADSQAAVLLTNVREPELVDKLSGHQARVISLDDDAELISAQAAGNPIRQVNSDNLAYIIYTSGSTGQPKGVAIEHRNTVALLCWARSEFSDAELAGMLASTSVCFDLSVFEIFAPLSWGGKVIVVPDALHLSECPAAAEVTLVNSVPSVITEVLRAHGLPGSVRTVSLAGEALPKRLVRELYQQPVLERVLNLYGPSEDTTYSTGATMLRDGESRVLIGRPLDNRQSYILDEQLRPVPVGATGELYLSGDGLTRGYLGRPELTAEKFIPNLFSNAPGTRFYKTGDSARYLPDGQIDYLGRRDNQVKLRGFRIELDEIEEALCKHEKVKAAAVVARENGAGEKQLVAYVVDANGTELSAGKIRNYLRERLPEHMIPAAVVRLEALPLTSNGKLDRRALPSPERDDVASQKPYVAPRNPIESELVTIWEEVIGVTPIGIADNFFEVGGHSLSAIRLMARIETHFGRKPPLATLIQSGTVERMAELLSSELTPHATALVPIQTAGSKRPLFFMHPSGGGVLCYRDLASHLGLGQPFYGLQDPVLDGGDKIYDSIPEMATDYLQAVRSVQEEGPYLLGGYSFGGLIAFEMAQQLRNEGQEIAALLILDSMSPASSKRVIDLEAELGVDDSLILFQDAREQAQQMGVEFNVTPEQLRDLALEERLLFVFEEVKRAKLLPYEFGLADVRGYLRMHRGRRMAIRDYVAQPYPDQITLFRTSEPPREPLRELAELLDPLLLEQFHQEQLSLLQQTYYGWDKVSPQPINAYEAAGGHFTMLSEPHVGQLGKELAIYLDALERTSHLPEQQVVP